ncbi:hypothetical protein F511_27378 [Dorcoceras hygrometricum]|uniref:Uncharacterized protein n=1 Tax=Dorcoceras hygrometricum TaxID=472368 RepID=A0A2Z7BCN8_9LAMI|nr:hypothetical protein F511_27378 [Dorcoceras hygrometricum]
MRDDFKRKCQMQQLVRGQSSQQPAKRPYQGLLRARLLRGSSSRDLRASKGHRVSRHHNSRGLLPLDLEGR